jgi:hypothetical protein
LLPPLPLSLLLLLSVLALCRAVNFFSPMARYSYAIGSGADGSALQQEFKLLVREAHKRGIEVGGWWQATACGNSMVAQALQAHAHSDPCCVLV